MVHSTNIEKHTSAGRISIETIPALLLYSYVAKFSKNKF